MIPLEVKERKIEDFTQNVDTLVVVRIIKSPYFYQKTQIDSLISKLHIGYIHCTMFHIFK